MKTTEKNTILRKQVLDFLVNSARHSGYIWDGLEIAPGIAVASFKTIAAETGLSYYRVKKCMAELVDSGVIMITRHKCFAVFTFLIPLETVSTLDETDEKEPRDKTDIITYNPARSAIDLSAAEIPLQESRNYQPRLSRAERRRLARAAEKKAPYGSGQTILLN